MEWKAAEIQILVDFSLHPIGEQSKLILSELLEDRYDRYGEKSTVIVSQLPVKNWYDMLASPTLADAILDRLVHNAYQIKLQGESMRKTMNNRSGWKLPPGLFDWTRKIQEMKW